MPSEQALQLLQSLSSPYGFDPSETPLANIGLNAAIFAQLAVSHKVYPMVSRNLRQACELRGSPVPFASEVVRHLEPVVFRWHVRLRRLNAANDQLRDTLSTEHIPFIFLRGVGFAEAFYPNARLRTSNDIDLLVTPEQVSVAVERLLSLGYAYVKPEAFRDAQFKRISQVELITPEGIPVDLNCRLAGNGRAGGFSKDMDLIWSNATRLGEYEYRLSTGDTLLHMLRHVSQGHEFEEGVIKGCADIEAIMAKDADSIDWQNVSRQAIKCRALRAVALYADYFDRSYRAPNMPALCSRLDGSVSRLDHFIFRRCLIKPRLKISTLHGLTKLILHVNMGVLLKCFMAQDLKLLYWLFFRGVVWPPHDMLILIDDQNACGSIGLRRLRVWTKMLVCVPGIFLGMVLRTLSGLCSVTRAMRSTNKI